MIISIILFAGLIAALLHFGNHPDAIAMDEKIQAARDEHRKAMLDSGILR
jgi:hypothetical protein